MTFKVSESILMLKKAKNLGKYKIFLMAVYIIFKYGKRFRFAPSFNDYLGILRRPQHWRNLTIVTSELGGRLRQIFAAFSKNLNFTNL